MLLAAPAVDGEDEVEGGLGESKRRASPSSEAWTLNRRTASSSSSVPSRNSSVARTEGEVGLRQRVRDR